MKNLLFSAAVCLLACLSSAFSSNLHPLDDVKTAEKQTEEPSEKEKPMRLGNFSVSLTVKDLEASKVFYEKLGFKVFAAAPR